MKKKITTVVALILCAVLLVAGSIAGTIAYLTAKTSTITNTFSVGNVALTLDESKVDLYGDPVEGAARVMENAYKLIPGEDYVKDPTVHVTAGSEESYIFVKVVNGISEIEADGNTIATQMAAKGWVATTSDDIFVYKLAEDEDDVTEATLVDALAEQVDLTVFEEFTIATGADVAAKDGATITIRAAAIQANNVSYSDALTSATDLLNSAEVAE